VTGLTFETVEVPKAERERLAPILDQSFEGIYRWHAGRTLKSIEVVRAARTPDGADAGLIMLKTLREGSGYVYYVAVLPAFRGKGVGGRLLDEAIRYFAEKGVGEVYASAEEDNEESKALFQSRGFQIIEASDMNEKYGALRTRLMYFEMMYVSGEVLLVLRLPSPARAG